MIKAKKILQRLKLAVVIQAAYRGMTARQKFLTLLLERVVESPSNLKKTPLIPRKPMSLTKGSVSPKEAPPIPEKPANMLDTKNLKGGQLKPRFLPPLPPLPNQGATDSFQR